MHKGVIATGNEIIPVEIIEEPFEDESLELELYKSLYFMKDRFEFIERDEAGLKVRVRGKLMRDEFPYEVGYVVVSDYDERKYLVTRIDPENSFIWFGSWE
ncbi:MAG TPA: hypothetical protein DDW65_20085 [Firmicutes bacterium]|jgi:hypothetical protein|nr:hypothetical protein [Bacillota bacterium]